MNDMAARRRRDVTWISIGRSGSAWWRLERGRPSPNRDLTEKGVGQVDRERLEGLLVGKVIAQAELGPGSVVLLFGDGTRLVREKTFEGLVQATLFGPAGDTIITAVLN